MNVLLIDPQNILAERVRDFSCSIPETTILKGEELGEHPSDSLRVDTIVGGGGDLSDRLHLIDPLLAWRTHPHTYLVPCWIMNDFETFAQNCLWPRLTIDRFREHFDISSFCEWLAAVVEWQQNRMQPPTTDSFANHSVLELITSLGLRRGTGKLSLFDEERGEGALLLRDGCLLSAKVQHLRAEEAFFEILSWSAGSYHWEPQESPKNAKDCQSVQSLMYEGLRLIRDANILYHFLPNMNVPLRRTDSESALDDGAVPFFTAQRELYNLIDGRISASQLIQASPLSRPRTLSCLAKWFSLGDIVSPSELPDACPSGASGKAPFFSRDTGRSSERPHGEIDLSLEDITGDLADIDPVGEEGANLPETRPDAAHRLLVVDDSNLMCRALQDIFSQDERFEIVGIARDGIEALKLIEQKKPDVLTLDMHMPRMDGLTTLKHIMIRDPKPVVVLSAFTKETSKLTYDSFKYGAIDVLTKPSTGNLQEMEKESEELRDCVARASRVRMEAAQYIRRKRKNSGPSGPHPASDLSVEYDAGQPIVTLVCGAGGFPSLLKLLFSIDNAEGLPPIIICMAMPNRVIKALAPNLEQDCSMRIIEVSPGITLDQGTCYLYSHDDCYHISRNGSRIEMNPCVDRPGHCDPFNHLLFSIAESFGRQAVAMLISGTGEDGIEGMRSIQQEGGMAFVLSPESCLKPDLSQKVLEAGHAREVKSVEELAGIVESLRKHPEQESTMACL